MPIEIQLRGGSFAIVDECDEALVSRYKWHRIGDPAIYCRTNIKGADGQFRTVLMHRLLMGEPEGLLVDHKNGNGLDNRRDNLRIATPPQNSVNKLGRGSSGFAGVRRTNGKWVATVCPDGNEIYIGSFDDPADAARAYNEAARIVFGRFARLNEVDEPPCGRALVDSAIASKWARIDRLQLEIDYLTGRRKHG